MSSVTIVVNGAESGLSETFPAIWQYFLSLLRGEDWQCPWWLSHEQIRSAIRDRIPEGWR